MPCPRVSSVRPDKQVVFLVGDEVDPAKVHGLVCSVEADVSFLGLARVSGRPYHQSVDVAEDALIFRVRVGASHDPGAHRLSFCARTCLGPKRKIFIFSRAHSQSHAHAWTNARR